MEWEWEVGKKIFVFPLEVRSERKGGCSRLSAKQLGVRLEEQKKRLDLQSAYLLPWRELPLG